MGYSCSLPEMGMFTTIKRWKDKKIPSPKEKGSSLHTKIALSSFQWKETINNESDSVKEVKGNPKLKSNCLGCFEN